ncbi:hypothetical protein NPIL_256401 [Nephila pilipes]|uniref:Uncharacterized protein n=1 Tax=Nephila pilipes TaxID=299642 RepID=A0A8X6QGE7_NEPPI|nr:hypothetical protein NPIL_256401 [Nephila pilipes]
MQSCLAALLLPYYSLEVWKVQYVLEWSMDLLTASDTATISTSVVEVATLACLWLCPKSLTSGKVVANAFGQSYSKAQRKGPFA